MSAIPSDPPALVLRFGKYKGQSIKLIIREDPKYILWLSKQQWLTEDVLNDIKKRIDQLALPFGRHEGNTMLVIKHTDPSYYDWVLKDTRLQAMS